MIEFDVHIKAGDLYDFMLYHTYHGFSGIFGALLGAALLIIGVSMKNWIPAAAGVLLLVYLPWSLFLKSRQQALLTPAFKEPLHYKLDDEGIHVSQGEKEEMIKWDGIVKAVASPKSIFVYTSRIHACIFPRKDMGEYTAQAIGVLSTHLPADKVKIRQ